MSSIEYLEWMQQPLIWGERCRGRGLVWTPESDWFINDPLGPKPHSHDDATELLYMAQGQMEIELGGSRRIYRQGDLLLMPPDKFHSYRFHGMEPACIFVAVTPNHKYNRWRLADFPPGAHEGDGPYANVFETDSLPSNEHFDCQRVTLNPGQSEASRVLDLQDRIVYVVSGVAHLTVSTLSGPLAANQYQYIPATVSHTIRNAGYEPLVYLSFVITDPYTAGGTEPPENSD